MAESTSPVPASVAGHAVFLDIDGTLLHHAESPDAVSVDPGLVARLVLVREAAGGALALISGRSIADIDTLFSPERFACAGQHGTERRGADGRIHRHAPPAHGLREVAARLRSLARARPGLLLEDKGESLALHFRAEPALAALVEREARLAVAALGHPFEVLAGKYVFEVKPGGKDKGTAIAEFLAEAPFAARVPVFIGDDVTDEHGFELVNRRGGVSIKVGPGATVARARLRDADAVARWLASLDRGSPTSVSAPEDS